jgi:hypothetical protein
MAQNPTDPQESFGPTKSKSITEEDVRVSNRISLKDFFETDVSDDERLKRKAELELMLIARLETRFDPMVYLGSAGTINAESSELRVIAARGLADLFFDVQTGLGQEVKDDEERIKREQSEGAKAFKEQEERADKGEGAAPTPFQTLPDPDTRTTTPEAELELLARFSKKAEGLVNDQTSSPKLAKEDSVVDTNRAETPARRENQVVATGANPKPDDPKVQDKTVDKANDEKK